MWILPKNYPLSSAFAQGMVESKEDLTSQELNIESSLTLKSKPMSLQTWLRKWNQESYHQALFTRILKPSHRTSFEEKLTSLLEDTLVNLSPYQEVEKEKMTKDTCGSISGSTFKQLDLLDSFLKTSRDTSRLDSPQSLAIWKKMVTKQRGEYSQRMKLAHHTGEKEFSSWGTPTAHIAKEGGYPAEWTRNTPTLTAQATASENKPHSSGKLNPEWVEWLMGLPTNWTDLGSWGTE